MDWLPNSGMVRLRTAYLLWSQQANHGCRGLVATFQAFQKGLGPFLVTRLLLGCVKIPGNSCELRAIADSDVCVQVL